MVEETAQQIEEPRITTVSLTVADRKALTILKQKLARNSNTDTLRALIWLALESNYPDEYEKLKQEREADENR
jgi:hypothetical protein